MVQEHKCGSMDKACGSCEGLYFSLKENAKHFYNHCWHKAKCIEDPSLYPEEMKRLMDGSNELSPFKANIHSYNSALSFASMGAQIVNPPERTILF